MTATSSSTMRRVVWENIEVPFFSSRDIADGKTDGLLSTPGDCVARSNDYATTQRLAGMCAGAGPGDAAARLMVSPAWTILENVEGGHWREQPTILYASAWASGRVTVCETWKSW